MHGIAPCACVALIVIMTVCLGQKHEILQSLMGSFLTLLLGAAESASRKIAGHYLPAYM